MNLDMTFCSGSRCMRANTCERWTENLYKEAERRKWDLDNRPISMAEFADHNGECRGGYIPYLPEYMPRK